MRESDLLAEEFERHRARLRAVAYRMLGSVNETDDAVQEAWFRLARTDAAAVQNLRITAPAFALSCEPAAER